MRGRRPAVHVTAKRERVVLGAQVKARTRGTVDAVVAIHVPRDLLARIAAYDRDAAGLADPGQGI